MTALILWLIYWCGVGITWTTCGEKPAIILALMYILFALLQIYGKLGG